jgi:HSP20 family protein
MAKVFTKVIPSVRIERLDIDGLQSRVERLFAAIKEIVEMENSQSFGAFVPSVDLSATDEVLTVSIEVPGIEADQLQITLNGDKLCIEGMKKRRARRDVKYLCCEREYGDFSRCVRLPWAIRMEKATADLRDGVLTIKLPKLLDRRGKALKIPIASAED